MKVIAIINPKGGTGKTVLAENLFVEASGRKETVAIIDLDPLATATKWGDRRGNDSAIISAHASRLERILDTARFQGTELAIIDTPAHDTEIGEEAARAADLVLTPVRPCIPDMEALVKLRRILERAGNPKAFVVVNAAPIQGTRHEDVQAAAKNDFGLEVCPIVLRERVAFHDALVDGKGVLEHAPKSQASEEVRLLARFTRKQLNP